MAVNYISDLFMRDDLVDPPGVVDIFEPVINDEMNEDLCKPYSAEEISNALFQIGPLKAPRPDGYPTRFFQRNWIVMMLYGKYKNFFRLGSCRMG